MVVENSPLRGLSAPEQQALLDKWHVDGFTPIPIKETEGSLI
jgi:hypothetical protein